MPGSAYAKRHAPVARFGMTGNSPPVRVPMMADNASRTRPTNQERGTPSSAVLMTPTITLSTTFSSIDFSGEVDAVALVVSVDVVTVTTVVVVWVVFELIAHS